jgi:hypothetical protein
VFGTAIALASVLGFVLPGFLVAQLAGSLRASSGIESDWTLVLRALSYSLAIHLVALYWTIWLYDQIKDDREQWREHVIALGLYGGTVLLATPVVLGWLLGRYLAAAESRGALRRWHYALGARDARDAWDYVFQRTSRASFVIVRTDKELVAGRYTTDSWAGKTPAPHDLYLEEVWLLDENQVFVGRLEPHYGVWFRADTIKDIYFADPQTDQPSLATMEKKT